MHLVLESVVVTVSVATRAVLGDAAVIWLVSEPVHLGSGNIDVLMMVVMGAAVVLGEDLMTMGVNTMAAALSIDCGNDGDKDGKNFVHGCRRMRSSELS